MSSKLIVREATEVDAGDVFVMSKALATSFVVNEASFDRSFKKILLTQNHALFVAELRKKVVGYSLAFFNTSLYANGNVAWLEELYVIPDFRGSGVGRELVHHYETWAIKNECAVIAVATRRAEQFYSVIGYEASATYFRKKLRVD